MLIFLFAALAIGGPVGTAAADDLTVTRTDLQGPDGTEAFGRKVTVLSNGNYVVVDEGWDIEGTENVGAIFVYNGETDQLISTQTGKSAGDHHGVHIVPLGNGNFVLASPFFDHGDLADAGAVTLVDGSQAATRSTSVANSLVGTAENQHLGASTDVTVHDVWVLRNSNYVVTNPSWGNTGVAGPGAVTWGSGTSGVSGEISSSNSLIGTTPGDFDNVRVWALRSGNYVVTSPQWDNGEIIDAGAATWADGYSGVVGQISVEKSLIGTFEDEQVGTHLTLLRNGNYVIQNGDYADEIGGNCNNCVLSATWANEYRGIAGPVSSANSLMSTGSNSAMSVLRLLNGNYVVSRPGWNRGDAKAAGAVTWGDGMGGLAGEVSVENSLVGTHENDQVGDYMTALRNGNFVVLSQRWNGGIGAATWGDGSAPLVGDVSPVNSLTGPPEYAEGIGQWDATPLSNGNFLVSSNLRTQADGLERAQNCGMITWANGASGAMGQRSVDNSFSAPDEDCFVLTLANGNYVIYQPGWSEADGAPRVGAATWADGNIGIVGSATTLNSLVGRHDWDFKTGSLIASDTGNYVVSNPLWDADDAVDAGAVTWVNGATGLVGEVTPENSLVGRVEGDCVGGNVPRCNDTEAFNAGGVSFLRSGNLVVSSPFWNADDIVNAGAVTWVNGDIGITGPVTAQNSLIGGSAEDRVGERTDHFRDGNYIVLSGRWNSDTLTDAGAATWVDGAVGIVGNVSSNNSLTGFKVFESEGPNDSGDWVTGLIQQDASFVAKLPRVCTFCGTGGVVAIAGRGLVGPVSSSDSATIAPAEVGNPIDDISVGNPFDYIDHSGRRLTSNGAIPVPTSANLVVLLQIAGLPLSDLDADGIADELEITLYGTDPNNPDSDDDGAADGADAFPLDPRERSDTDGDGVGDNSDYFPNDPSRWAMAVPAMTQALLLVLVFCLGLIGRRRLLS
ncbi:MAG: hypothetical protein P8P79_16930 [Halioglobus sp.]|nr:hypothetical protein [Halioglobus sp.]